MSRSARKLLRVTKILLAGVTIFCVSWIACVNEWHSGIRWKDRRIPQETFSTMRTIVAYSESKQAELDKPSPVACSRLPAFPKIPYIVSTLKFILFKISFSSLNGFYHMYIIVILILIFFLAYLKYYKACRYFTITNNNFLNPITVHGLLDSKFL